ncbi:hypothetical protein CsSME_00022592 [Camellia sinensis var. sinensis]
MDLGGKMEDEVEIKCDADELFQICSGKKAHTVPNLSPDEVSKLDLHKGEWGDHGSIKVWTYVTGHFSLRDGDALLKGCWKEWQFCVRKSSLIAGSSPYWNNRDTVYGCKIVRGSPNQWKHGLIHYAAVKWESLNFESMEASCWLLGAPMVSRNVFYFLYI